MTATPPLTPRAFMRSLKDRAANASKINGVPASELVDRYFHCRLLARVFHADHDGWILKGGQALLVRWPRARYSTDIDLFRTGHDTTIDDAVDALIAATSTDMDDHLQFSHHDTAGETNAGQPIRKVRFKVMFGLKQLSMVSVDVVDSELFPRGRLVVEQLAAPFEVDSSPWPWIRMWPLEDHVADKIAAMYERHRKALSPSNRFKDLVDLVLIARNSTLSGELTHAALHSEVRRRNDAGGHLILPPAFTVPGPAWVSGYGAQASKTHGVPSEYRTLEGATPLADAFISPLLGEQPPAGAWRFDRLTWSNG